MATSEILEVPHPKTGEVHRFRMHNGNIETRRPGCDVWEPYEFEESVRRLSDWIERVEGSHA